MNRIKNLDKAIRMCDDVSNIYVTRRNKYYVDVKLGKSNPYISAMISKTLKKDKRVEGLMSSPTKWEVFIEGDDNAAYIKNLLSGFGNIM